MIVIPEGYNINKFRIFVCYRESNGGQFADILHLIFTKANIGCFVAHKERNRHAKDFDNIRRKILENIADFFIFINTEGALSSYEVNKEFNMAYPNVEETARPELIIIHHRNKIPRPTVEQFKQKVGVTIKKSKNIPSFRDDSELVDIICNIAETHNMVTDRLSKEDIKDQLALNRYIRYCISLRDNKNSIDKKNLSSTYIPNRMVEVDSIYWDSMRDENFDSKFTEWNVEKYLSGDERYVLIGSDFGVGKTSFLYTLTSDLAIKYVSREKDIVPIYIPLNGRFQNIDNFGNNLGTILSFIPKRSTKILFIFDGLDEYGNISQIAQLYNRQVTQKLQKYPNCKFIFTSRLIEDIPEVLKLKKCVRLLSFSKEQIGEFFKKYDIDTSYPKLKKDGLTFDIIRKPLFCWMYAITYKKKRLRLDMGIDTDLRKTILYFDFIHSLLRGKYIGTSETRYEKWILRKIAALKMIYKEKLYESDLRKKLDILVGIEGNTQLKMFFGKQNNTQSFQHIITSYFHTSGTFSSIEFIHESFLEYLLAEFYLESLINNRTYRLNVGIPSKETIKFLASLTLLLENKNNDPQIKNVSKSLLQSLLINTEKDNSKTFVNKRILEDIVKNAKETFENDTMIYPIENNIQKVDEFWISIKDLQYRTYSELLAHKSIAFFIITLLRKTRLVDSYQIALFLEEYSAKLSYYLKDFSRIDLSSKSLYASGYSKKFSSGPSIMGLNFDGSKLLLANLSEINLARSTFILANLSRTKLSSSNISKCDFTQSLFFNSDLSNVYARETDFYGSTLIKCKLNGGEFAGCNFSETTFIGCFFDNATDFNESRFTDSTITDDKLLRHIHKRGGINVPHIKKNNKQ